MRRHKITLEDKQEKFIKKANIIHDNFYDYSLVVYKYSQKPVKIICPVHGVFEQSPTTHANDGCGCSKCWYDSKRKSIENYSKSYLKKIDYEQKRKKKKILSFISNNFTVEELDFILKLKTENMKITMDEIIEKIVKQFPTLYSKTA